MKNTFTALCLLLSLNAFCQTTYFVNANASGGNNGTSWTDAFTKLQDALSTAESGDQVWVAAGIYYPDEGAGLTDNDRTQSFRLKTGVAIYGGFAGTETALTERKITANITTLSGDIDQDDAPENNAYHVVQSSSVNNTAVLDCFTITGGNANDAPAPNFYGGGMYNNASSPTLIGCSFIENTAVYDGGGIFNVNSSPILTRCSFAQNTAPVRWRDLQCKVCSQTSLVAVLHPIGPVAAAACIIIIVVFLSHSPTAAFQKIWLNLAVVEYLITFLLPRSLIAALQEIRLKKVAE
ncbi:MAG: hypothetical protein WKG06_06405 [Segetibacter sp.]